MYSKALPENLRDTAASSAADPNNLVLNEAIGAVDARLVQLMGGLSRDAGGKQAWRDMRLLIEQLEEAYDTENKILMRQTFRKSFEILHSQFREFSIWEEIYQGFEIRRKLVETESKRREKAATMVPATQVFVFMHQVALAVARHVTNQQEKYMVAMELQKLANFQLPEHRGLAGIMLAAQEDEEAELVEVEG